MLIIINMRNLAYSIIIYLTLYFRFLYCNIQKISLIRKNLKYIFIYQYIFVVFYIF